MVNEKNLEDEEFLGKTPHITGGNPQKEIQENIQNNSADISSTPAGLQTTPGNLPVIDMEAIGFGEVSQNDEGACTDLDNDAEPTEEELKAVLQ